MKRVISIGVLCVLVLSISVEFGSAAPASPADKNGPQVRLLTGQVMDKSEAPIGNAVVYLKNTKTLTVKTFITDASGQFRFPALAPNVDYEIYAEQNGRKSDTKTLSSFDTRPHALINLKIQ